MLSNIFLRLSDTAIPKSSYCCCAIVVVVVVAFTIGVVAASVAIVTDGCKIRARILVR